MTKKKELKQDNYETFRSFPLYIILSCGILILLIGIYLTIHNTNAGGINLPNKFGQGGGQSITVNGPYLLVIGFLITIFPAFKLIKRS